jgi:hypothetical protein
LTVRKTTMPAIHTEQSWRGRPDATDAISKDECDQSAGHRTYLPYFGDVAKEVGCLSVRQRAGILRVIFGNGGLSCDGSPD